MVGVRGQHVIHGTISEWGQVETLSAGTLQGYKYLKSGVPTMSKGAEKPLQRLELRG
jgi:hypothetical protein